MELTKEPLTYTQLVQQKTGTRKTLTISIIYTKFLYSSMV
jgi:hypothetical protein